MKKQLLLALTLLGTLTVFSQDLPNYSSIKLETREDYDSNANNAAYQSAAFLFSTPVDKDNPGRLLATQYLLKWMTGSPDYTFTFDEATMKISKKDPDLLGMLMAGMAKYSLENKAATRDSKKVNLNAVRLVLQYARQTANNVKVNKELKKALEADASGQLEEYLQKK